MKKLINPKVVKVAVPILILVLFGVFLLVFNSTDARPITGKSGTSAVKYERAKITRIISENIEKDTVQNGVYRGSQRVELELMSGDYKGDIVESDNYISALYSVICKPGTNVIVTVSTSEDSSYTVSVYSYDRAAFLYALIAAFFLIMCIIGGKKGIKSVLGLIFTFLCIFMLFIPMLYRGYSPIASSLLIVAITTCVSLWLLGGITLKTICAVLGTVLGVAIAGIISLVAGELAHLSGFTMDESETLLLIAQDHTMQVKGLLFAGILIASLGAVMDMAMSIASTIQELHTNNPTLDRKKLFLSGMNVGHDMMGTMTSTLILAFTGSALNTLIVIYSYNVPYYQLINTDMIGIEIIQGIAGSIAVVLTVPIVAFLSAELLIRFQKNQPQEQPEGVPELRKTPKKTKSKI